MGKIKDFILNVILICIRIYQYLLSQFFGQSCRFYPTCSTYMITALQSYGILRGLFFGTRRILRCHPWCEGGFDPVPERNTK